MIYFVHDQQHCLLWPVLAVGWADDFWIGLGWLDFEIGWRTGEGGDSDELKEQNT